PPPARSCWPRTWWSGAPPGRRPARPPAVPSGWRRSREQGGRLRAAGGSEGAPVSEQDRYSPEEWRTLQFAPFWMFSAVVGAYGGFDPRRFQGLCRLL